ncbi:MAG: hypothetical protein ACRD8W_25430, partial [Nitrososphaeraceae archaeon]
KCFANPTYLQLETLVTQFNLRFRLAHSKYPFIYTNVIVINANIAKTFERHQSRSSWLVASLSNVPSPFSVAIG